MAKEDHRPRKMRRRGDQQEGGVADGALHRQRFLFRIFRLIEHDDIAARYAEALRHSRPGLRRADGVGFCRRAGKDHFRSRILLPQANALRQARQAVADKVRARRPLRVPGIAAAQHHHVAHRLLAAPGGIAIFYRFKQAVCHGLQAQQRQQQPAEAHAKLPGTLKAAEP